MVLSLDLPARMTRGGTLLLGRFLTGLWFRYIAWAAWRRSLDALRELPPHLLDDVGLTPADQRQGRPL